MLAQGKFPVWDSLQNPPLWLYTQLVIVNPSVSQQSPGLSLHTKQVNGLHQAVSVSITLYDPVTLI